MKKVLVMMSLMYVAGLSARHATVESESELDRLLNKHNFSVVAFVDSQSPEGKEINHNLRKASNREEFGKELRDKVGFFLVRAERDKNHEVAKKHGYNGTPFFATFKRDYKTKSSNMSGDFSDQNIRQFLRSEFDSELEELQDKIEAEKERKSQYHDDLSPRLYVGYGVGYRPWYNRWWYGPSYRHYGYGRRYHRAHGHRYHGHRRHGRR